MVRLIKRTKVMSMHHFQLPIHSLPLVRETGYMYDTNGEFTHPNRKMEKIHVFVFVVEGCIYVCENGVEYSVKKGSYLFLRKNNTHWGTKHYHPGTKWFYIHFYEAPTVIGDKPEYNHLTQTSLIYEDVYDSKISFPIHGEITNVEYMAAKLQKLVSMYEQPLPMRPLHLSIAAYQFFTELYSNQLEKNQEANKHYVVNQMIDLMRNSKHNLTGEEIAETLGMNYAYLSTLFKKQTGMSVKRFQNELLIEKAIEMFKKKEGNVSEVSDALGFSNPFYFSRVFKKVTGVPPTTYINERFY